MKSVLRERDCFPLESGFLTGKYRRGAEPPAGARLTGSPRGDGLFTDENFWQRYIDRYFELRDGPFATANVHAIIDGMAAELMDRAPKLCADIGVDFSCEIVGQFDPPAFDEACVSAVRSAAERLGYSHMDIVSGAGHDACWINRVAPTAMVMCPCVDGLSHNEAEEISKEWAMAGADVLMHAVVETAEIVT